MLQLRRELATSWLWYHGESPRTIRRRGFSLIVMPEREPLAIDWDDPPHVELPRPFRQRRQLVVS
ncbi:MAG: hypothetical protein JNM18_13590 [Planctomycetaceae bacterium]|nr:hypothetical protein [Planctomycetaceae bacterium]